MPFMCVHKMAMATLQQKVHYLPECYCRRILDRGNSNLLEFYQNFTFPRVLCKSLKLLRDDIAISMRAC